MWYEPEHGTPKKMDVLVGALESHDLSQLSPDAAQKTRGDVGSVGHVIRLKDHKTVFTMPASESGGIGLAAGSRVVLHSLEPFPDTQQDSAHSVLGIEVMDATGTLIVFTRASAGYVLRKANGEAPGEVVVAAGAPMPASRVVTCR